MLRKLNVFSEQTSSKPFLSEKGQHRIIDYEKSEKNTNRDFA